jgi:hypothetical protein
MRPKISTSTPRPALICGLALLIGGAWAGSAHAGEVYGGGGLQGLLIGYSQPLSDRASLRIDYSTLGSLSRTKTEEGIIYSASIDANRIGMFADWFVTSSRFRLTGGVTSNNFKGELVGGGTGSTIAIGNNTYALSSGDRFDVQIKFPNTTPFLGIGWGHQQAERGWGFHAEVGASIGKAKVSAKVSGNLASLVSQTDIDAELAQIREGAGKITFLPQISAGVSYRF